MPYLAKGVSVTYAFDEGKGTLTRTIGGSTVALIEGVNPFAYSAYMVTGAEVDLSDLSTATTRTAASNVTKQVQIHPRATRASATDTSASNTVLSARFILRNKQVTV